MLIDMNRHGFIFRLNCRLVFGSVFFRESRLLWLNLYLGERFKENDRVSFGNFTKLWYCFHYTGLFARVFLNWSRGVRTVEFVTFLLSRIRYRRLSNDGGSLRRLRLGSEPIESRRLCCRDRYMFRWKRF